jgi:hypothetical protein
MIRRLVLNRGTPVRSAMLRVANLSTTPTPAPAASNGGSSLFQRLSAFLVGCGVGFGSSQYFVIEELHESNSKFEAYLDSLEARIKALEK